MRLDGAWDQEEVEEFLIQNKIPVRLACRTPTGSLWMVSLWYRYEDAHLICATSSRSDIVRFLRNSPECAFEVSTNTPPYQGVRGRGEVEIGPDPEKQELRTLLRRYLGDDDSELGKVLLNSDREESVLRLEPDRAYSWDFSERMPPGGSGESYEVHLER